MNTPAFRPLGARYLVLPDPVEANATKVGEYTVDRDRDIHKKSSSGTVVCLGGGCMELSRGARISYGQYSGYEQKLEEVTYIVLQENEILGELLQSQES